MGGSVTTVDDLLRRIERCRRYFGKTGGVTVSGGEPLMQAEFVASLFAALKRLGIHTALDTSGLLLNESVKTLLQSTDLVLLDYKYTNPQDYLAYTGMEQSAVDRFLQYLQQNDIPTWLRHVYIPTLNDTDQSLARLCALRSQYSCVKKIELLPFRRLCLEKYQSMGLDFPLADTPEPSNEEIAEKKKKFPCLNG